MATRPKRAVKAPAKRGKKAAAPAAPRKRGAKAGKGSALVIVESPTKAKTIG
jgi:reverse gyrase